MKRSINFQNLKFVAGGSAGNMIEWYDWYVYSAFSLYFAPVFFPRSDRTAELLSAAAVFAVGFIMRPVGAWIMGIYADRYGRKAGLTFSISLMCLGSLMIAIAPGYAQIGAAAPFILVLARLIQGLSVGGEYGASSTYLVEMASSRHRGFFASFIPVTLISGQLLALGVLLMLQSSMSEAALHEWGWRIPFAIGSLLGIAVFYLRRNLVETESFRNEQCERSAGRGLRSSGFALFTQYPKKAFLVMALTSGGTLAFYTSTTYLHKFLVNTTGFDRGTATQITTAALLVYMFIQPMVGALSDKIGRKPIMIAFGVMGVLFTYPVFIALSNVSDPYTAFMLAAFSLIIVTGYTSINVVVKTELFPTHIRALGVALPFAIANALFGGTAEYVALWFKSRGMEQGFFWYVTIMIGLSLIVYLTMRDTRKYSEIKEG